MMRSTWLDFFRDLLFAAIAGLLAGIGIFLGLDRAGCTLLLSKLGASLAGLGVAAVVLWQRVGRERRDSRWQSSGYGRDFDSTGPGADGFVASVIVDVVVNVLDD
jgi:hypothetical protein